MADAEWKDRLGFPVNYNPSEEEDVVELRRKPNSTAVGTDTADFTRFEDTYGSTPPRTRIKIKSRDWNRKQEKEDGNTKSKTTRLVRARADRRNTVDCAILNQMIIEPTIGDSKRGDKKSLHLAREAERDTKLGMTNSVVAPSYRTSFTSKRGSAQFEAERAESLPSAKKAQVVPKLIESCNRFMSVKSKPLVCRISAPPSSFGFTGLKETPQAPVDSVVNNRVEFHDTFSNLIKLGSVDTSKRLISQEEQLWQTEVKDLIWLELQAWHADRSLEEEDKFLCSARQNIYDLLREIMTYRFERPSSRRSNGNASSTVDSGVSVQTIESSIFCSGCSSMYCRDCLDAQTIALKQVESLLNRLECAESLYQSTKAFGSQHPLYKSEAFVARVKALCLWYNMTRHHRLKLLILGKLLARLHSGKQHSWPITEANTSMFDESSDGSISQDTDWFSSEKESNSNNSDDIDSVCEVSYPSNRVLCPMKKDSPKHDSPTHASGNKSPYRKYIENVLKSRGLGKSLSFLHRLHNVVLRKARITLEKPGEIDFFEDSELFEDEEVPAIELMEPPMDRDQLEELRRYGVWSPEAKELKLPSYVPAFLFLSLIPLEVIHEFLKMRLETKVIKPNPLSLEQLLKELREGLSLAMIHRERYKRHITTALNEGCEDYEKHIAILEEFNKTCQKVFELYLIYVEQWIVKATPETHRKSALEDEWRFSKLISPMIPKQHVEACKHFCSIIQGLLNDIGAELVTKIKDLDNKVIHVEGSSPVSIKWQLLTICRETQQLFTSEREKVLKVLGFAKGLCRDVEKPEFHREHIEELHTNVKNFLCSEVVNAVVNVKKEAIEFRDVLISTIQVVQKRCDVKNLFDMEEQDRTAVITRTREILHQGFKFGFEFHKELHRLYEIRATNSKDDKYEKQLSLMTVDFSKLWMKFVMERTERGRGVRPRWAAQGFDFLIAACDPSNTKYLSDQEFEGLKKEMDTCISHVIGEPEKRKSPRNRKNSPLPPRSRTPSTPHLGQRSYLSQISSKSSGYTSESAPPSPTPESSSSGGHSAPHTPVIRITKPIETSRELKQVRIRDAINRLDISLDSKLIDKNLIGQVKELQTVDKLTIRAKNVNFSWHRGMKIGQGRFGKVYTAVNNSTGELMAMKEIPITPGETRAIRRVAEELKIFEGIQHKHLVKYYGVEIHREELLIFMELCPEGTLESYIEISAGLHESLARRFTAQLLLACQELHKNGIVHRDIKPANIFLTNDRCCLKLGDFGSAVKIEAHTTMPGELKGYVGTQAYMAPEVFTKTNTEGHGRAADIYSVGCCVIEMISGKRPWYQFDSSFQIMFKVGMGENPEIPENLSQEGQDFVELCLRHDPKMRPSATELLLHHFCKVGSSDEENKYLNNIETEVRRSFRSKKHNS